MKNNCNRPLWTTILFSLEHRFRNSTTQSNRYWFSYWVNPIIKSKNKIKIAIEHVIMERITKHEHQDW